MKNTKQVLKKRKRDLSVIQFQQLFNTEESCRDYLFNSSNFRERAGNIVQKTNILKSKRKSNHIWLGEGMILVWPIVFTSKFHNKKIEKGF